MVILNPKLKEQLRILREVSYNYAKKQPAGVVDLAIGMLKHHDQVRALCVVTNSFGQLSKSQAIILQILKSTTEGIKQLIKDSPNMTKEQVVAKIKKITLEPEAKKA